MPDTCLPTADNDLLAWAKMLSERLDAAGAVYGVSPSRVAAFGVLAADFAVALDACGPAVRNAMATTRKNTVRASLKQDARSILRTINGNQAVTDDERVAIGLAVRGAGRRAAVPDDAPLVSVQAVRGQTVTVLVTRPAGRAKPSGCVGLTLFARVDDPTLPGGADWRFVGNFGRTTIDVVFEALPPGTQVSITAEWMNSRFEPGPRAAGVSTHVQGDVDGPASVVRTVGRAGRAMARAA